MQQKLEFKNSIINYYKYGDGKKVLFCLHGYGEDGTSFSFLENHLAAVYTLYAIDLPFHGKTEWNEQESMKAEDLLSIFTAIHNNTFAILGYSFGGRIALSLLQKFPMLFERIVLIAPDGLHVNFWYWSSTQTWLGNKLFKITMQHPGFFFFFLNLLDKTSVLSTSIIKFVHYHLDDAHQRTLLYKRWSAMKSFKPNLALIKIICKENNIDLHFLFGNFDKIILSKHASVFERTKNIYITKINAGHRLLCETYAEQIVSLFNNQF